MNLCEKRTRLFSVRVRETISFRSLTLCENRDPWPKANDIPVAISVLECDFQIAVRDVVLFSSMRCPSHMSTHPSSSWSSSSNRSQVCCKQSIFM